MKVQGKKFFLLLITLLFFVVFFLLSLSIPGLKWDATQYLREARAISENVKPLALWLPLLSFIEAGFFIALGEEVGIILTKLFSCILASLLLPLLYLTTRKITEDEIKAVLASFAPLVFPFAYWTTKLYIDPVACVFLFLGFYFYTFKKGKQSSILAGIFFAFSALSKLFYLVFISAVLLLFGNAKKKLLVFTLCIVFILPWFSFSYFEFSNPLYVVKQTFFTYSAFSLKESAFHALGKILLYSFPVFLLFVFLIIAKRDKMGLLLLIWLLIYLFLPGGKDVRYAIPFLIFLFPYVSQINKKVLGISVFAFLFLNTFFLSIAFTTDYTCSGNSFKTAGEFLKDFPEEVCANDFWPLFSWYSGKEIKACVSKNEQKGYVIFVNPENEIKDCKIIKNFSDKCFFVYLAKC